MRRVLLTVHKFFPEHRAGTEVLTLKVAQELQRRGYEVLVVTADPPDRDARHASDTDVSNYQYEGVNVHAVRESMRLRRYTFRHEFTHPGIGAHFGEQLEQFKPDLVHIFHCQNLSGEVVHEARNRDIPVVASLTDFWFVCPVVQLKRPDGALCRGPKMSGTNCLTCYTPALFPPMNEITEAIEKKLPAAANVLGKLPKAVQRLAVDGIAASYVAGKLPNAVKATMQRPAFLRNSANLIDAIMVPTRLMQSIFIENGIKPELISLCPFGLDTKPLEQYQQKIASDQVRIGFIGTIFEHKGLDVLIKAFHNLPKHAKAVLKIYGSTEQFPDYSATLISMAQSGPNADKIKFLGTFPNSELGPVLQQLDVLVVPSRWYENTPLVMQSSFASKTPIIATDLGGMSEIINHGLNGMLFPVNDAAELTRQLASIINDETLLPALRAGIAPERTVAQMVDDIESIYETVLNRRQAKNAAPAPVAGASVIS